MASNQKLKLKRKFIKSTAIMMAYPDSFCNGCFFKDQVEDDEGRCGNECVAVDKHKDCVRHYIFTKEEEE